jgi:very-short-patch-repair endonuclease
MRENIKLPLYYGASIEIFMRAETLRSNMTESEKLLWNRLNNKQINGLKFRRQHPINQFIVDFYCHQAKLVIELDGGIHNKRQVAEHDTGREAMLTNYGLKILRFKNEEVLFNIENVISKIKHNIEESY